MFYNINPKTPRKRFGVFGFYVFLCGRLHTVQRTTKSDPTESNTMNTKDTIRIVLNGGADEHTVDLGRGQYVSVSVTGGKLKYMVHRVGGGEQAAMKRIEQLEQQLAAALEQKAKADELLLGIGQSDYVRRLVEEHSAEHSKARTALEARCFAPLCRVWSIRRDLKAFVTSMGSEWKKCDWCIAWKIFDDLRWWTGNQKEFASWVAELGYSMGKFKDAKRSYGEDCLAQWYAQAYGTGHFAVVARGLTAIFVGSPTKPTRPSDYEESYMDHTDLYRAIGRANAGTQGTRAYIHIESPGRAHRKHNKYDIYSKDSKDSKYRPLRSKECFIMATVRHKVIGTIDYTKETPVGVSRRLQAVHTPRMRRGRALPRGFPSLR